MGTIKVLDRDSVHRLTTGEAQGNSTSAQAKEARIFINKDIFSYQWIIFTTWKNNHFTIITAQPPHNKITQLDSLSTNLEAEIHAVHNFLRYMATSTNQSQHDDWTIDYDATSYMTRQINGVDCGIYAAMMVDCLVSDISLSALTPKVISDCRSHIAYSILSKAAPILNSNNVGLSFIPTPNQTTTPYHATPGYHEQEETSPSPDTSDNHTQTDTATQNLILNYPVLDPLYKWTPD